MQAELSGIWHGLRLAQSRNLSRVMIETDSTSVVHFLEDGCDILHPCAPIVNDIRAMIRTFDGIKWTHIFREANCCADALANNGHGFNWGIQFFSQVPFFMSIAYFADFSGTFFDRVA